MPTSSIFATIKIKTKEEAECFLSALEAAEKAIKVEKNVRTRTNKFKTEQ